MSGGFRAPPFWHPFGAVFSAARARFGRVLATACLNSSLTGQGSLVEFCDRFEEIQSTTKSK
jgi:hypothetical protein